MEVEVARVRHALPALESLQLGYNRLEGAAAAHAHVIRMWALGFFIKNHWPGCSWAASAEGTIWGTSYYTVMHFKALHLHSCTLYPAPDMLECSRRHAAVRPGAAPI